MAARLPVRILARHARSQYARRTFTSSSVSLEAHNFTMPAMSPTMTEGNIASWKVKEGDSFSTGDVLLEIETDKASMDVEAVDDGVMAKIFMGDGSKAIQVGTRIAVFADVGDDISSLKIPEDTSAPTSSSADNVKAQEEKQTSSPETQSTPENKQLDPERPKTKPTGPGQNPKYPLYPAVQSLILQNHIPEAEVSKIAASGPGGRLLKGDVLAYLGSIEADYPKKQSERIEHLAHLDLSNIKIAPVAPKPTVLPVEQALTIEVPKVASVSLSISLSEVLKVQRRVQETLGTTMPLSSFLARAVDWANDDLPLPKGAKASSTDLFNAVLGLDTVPTTSRGTYLPQIDALPAAPSVRRATRTMAKPDIIDILSGRAQPLRSAAGKATLGSMSTAPTLARGLSTTGGAINVFSVTVPVGEERRARTFLERMKTILQVEPGRLIL